MSLAVVMKVLSPKRTPLNWRKSLHFVKESIPFGLFFIGGVVYFQTDTILLSIMKGQAAVGIFQAPMRLMMTLDVLPLLISTAVYPTVCKAYYKARDEAKTILSESIRYLLMLGLPLAIALFFGAKDIIRLLFGVEFGDSALVLQILCLLIPVRFICHMMGTVLSASEKQTSRAVATGISAVLNILLNVLLIPKYSYYGSAAASVLTSFLLLVFYWFSTKNVFSSVSMKKLISLPMGSLALLTGVFYLGRDANLFLVGGGAAVIYLASLFVLKYVSFSDLRAISREFFKSR